MLVCTCTVRCCRWSFACLDVLLHPARSGWSPGSHLLFWRFFMGQDVADELVSAHGVQLHLPFISLSRSPTPDGLARSSLLNTAPSGLILTQYQNYFFPTFAEVFQVGRVLKISLNSSGSAPTLLWARFPKPSSASSSLHQPPTLGVFVRASPTSGDKFLCSLE